MRKTICDVCGKEIILLSKHYKVNISSDITPNAYNYAVKDVCEDCANSIYHYIKGLQKEENK